MIKPLMKNISLLALISVATVGLTSCAPMGPPYNTYSSTRVYENGYWVSQPRPWFFSNNSGGFSSQGSSGNYPSNSGFHSQGSGGSGSGFRSQGSNGNSGGFASQGSSSSSFRSQSTSGGFSSSGTG